jgi:5-methylcytosine-specific restriction endonuclease McrA
VVGACPCRRQQFDARRGSSWSRGYDRDWQVLRARHLAAHPWCERCQRAGIIEAATEVDHTIPFEGPTDPLRLDASNLTSLCKRCHSLKTATEDSTFAARGRNATAIPAKKDRLADEFVRGQNAGPALG